MCVCFMSVRVCMGVCTCVEVLVWVCVYGCVYEYESMSECVCTDPAPLVGVVEAAVGEDEAHVGGEAVGRGVLAGREPRAHSAQVHAALHHQVVVCTHNTQHTPINKPYQYHRFPTFSEATPLFDDKTNLP